jgi:hypothetical protein
MRPRNDSAELANVPPSIGSKWNTWTAWIPSSVPSNRSHGVPQPFGGSRPTKPHRTSNGIWSRVQVGRQRTSTVRRSSMWATQTGRTARPTPSPAAPRSESLPARWRVHPDRCPRPNTTPERPNLTRSPVRSHGERRFRHDAERGAFLPDHPRQMAPPVHRRLRGALDRAAGAGHARREHRIVVRPGDLGPSGRPVVHTVLRARRGCRP